VWMPGVCVVAGAKSIPLHRFKSVRSGRVSHGRVGRMIHFFLRCRRCRGRVGRMIHFFLRCRRCYVRVTIQCLSLAQNEYGTNCVKKKHHLNFQLIT
jgi:hypothetical protein